MIFVDTNVFINYLFETPLSEKAEKILSMEVLCTSGIVINETLFVIARTKAFKDIRIKSMNAFRDYIARNGYSFCESDLKDFYNVLEIAKVDIFHEHFDKDDFILTMTTYRLLPNDALIAATCKHYGIRKIATFDPDFKRVDFLEVIELEE
jgi:hypothetical protein